MKTRREVAKEQVSDSLPTAQQRVMAQLKTAMLNLNKKHGSNMTTEMLSQILQTVNVDFEDEDKQKPMYSDVPVDSELSSPPVPELHQTVDEKISKKLKPFPKWFSFDAISQIELDYFGPLFSMDEERWKVYLLTRNDVVRVAEELAFIDPSTLRARMHPKDDAALVFEIWKFMTKHGVINRSDEGPVVRQVVEFGLNGLPAPIPVPPQKVHAHSEFTLVKCSSCARECRFFCYKPVPPPEEEETDNMVDEETKEEDKEDEMFCHDCTPPFFKKIPLRLFIDADTRERIVKGEFEEVNSEDLKNFVLRAAEPVKQSLEKMETSDVSAALKITHKVFKSGNRILPGWEGYSVMSESGETAAKTNATNGLEILDPTMQEALTGAGSKIRGSVLIEQQVRNIIYGTSNRPEEDSLPTCSVPIERAFELVVAVIEEVAKNLGTTLSPGGVFLEAKKTDPVHAELVLLIHRICIAAKSLRAELIEENIDPVRIKRCIENRIALKQEFIDSKKIRNEPMIQVPTCSGLKGDIFAATFNVPLASMSSKQLNLAYL